MIFHENIILSTFNILKEIDNQGIFDKERDPYPITPYFR